MNEIEEAVKQFINIDKSIKNRYSIESINKKEAKEKLLEFQKYYNDLNDIIRILLNQKNETCCVRLEGVRYERKTSDVFLTSEKLIIEIQFRHLFPLALKLSEFSEEQAKYREGAILIVSIILSVFLPYCVPSADSKHFNKIETLIEVKSSQLNLKFDNAEVNNIKTKEK